MRKSDALNLVLAAVAVVCFRGATLNDNDTRFSMTQATVQQPHAAQEYTQTSGSRLISPDKKNHPYSSELVPDGTDPGYTPQADFSHRLQGGILLRFEFGVIVVKPTSPPGSLQPTALTTDAIITSSVRSTIAGQSRLTPADFEIQTDAGVVMIRSKEESLDHAAQVINLALRVPDVRQIVYTMPSSIWKTASAKARKQESGVAESGRNPVYFEES